MIDDSRPTVCVIVTAEVTATTFYKGYLAFLVEQGWRVCLIASSDGQLESFGAAQGAEVFSVPMKRNPSVFSDLVSLARLVRAVAEIAPDIVVTATPKAGLLGTTAAFICRVKARVYQLWGLRLETEAGLRRALFTLLERTSCALSTQVVANSHSLAARAVQVGVSAGKTITVLGEGSSHGVDLDWFSIDAEYSQPDTDTVEFLLAEPALPVVGFVGRLNRDKGLDTFLAAIELCSSENVFFNALVVGPPEDSDVASQLQNHPSSLALHCVGQVSDTRPYLNVMDVLCLPTRREGFPNVVLESAAMGVPCVVSDATGSIDSVVDGRTGLVFKTDDARALAAALMRITSDSHLHARLSAGGRDRVVSGFSQNRVWALQEANLRAQVSGAGKRSL